MNDTTNNDNAIILIRCTAKSAIFTHEGDGTEYRKKIQSDECGTFIIVNGLQYRLDQDDEEEPETVATMPELVEPPKLSKRSDDVAEIAEVDAICKEYTAFDDLAEMCDQPNYFPSFNVSKPHYRKIADAYDLEMKSRKDERRSHRYSDDNDDGNDTIIITLNQAMFFQSIHNMNDALETMGAESRVRTLSDTEKRTHRDDANLMVIMRNETHAVNNFGDALAAIFELEVLQFQRLSNTQLIFMKPYMLYAEAATNPDNKEAT